MNAFSDLPHISQVKPFGPEDAPLFAELAGVLNRHGALDRFGITLLHTHFPMLDGEVLREETDEEARVQTIQPAIRAEVTDSHVTETIWRLDQDGAATTICICPERRDPKTGETVHSGQHISRGR